MLTYELLYKKWSKLSKLIENRQKKKNKFWKKLFGPPKNNSFSLIFFDPCPYMVILLCFGLKKSWGKKSGASCSFHRDKCDPSLAWTWALSPNPDPLDHVHGAGGRGPCLENQ